ncbi:MAG: hypothetical protein ACI9TY_001625 [Alphaproteobacteria bacterium]|jgi:hypothetical protein
MSNKVHQATVVIENCFMEAHIQSAVAYQLSLCRKDNLSLHLRLKLNPRYNKAFVEKCCVEALKYERKSFAILCQRYHGGIAKIDDTNDIHKIILIDNI